jgi:hypothetical protein
VVARQAPRSLRPLILVTVVAILSGCGAGDADDPHATAKEHESLVRVAHQIEAADPPISKARFVARVNQLCRRAWPTIRHNLAVYRGTQDPGLSPERRFKQGISRLLLPEVESRIFDPVMALGAPREGKPELEEVMRWLGEAIEIGEGQFAITSPVLVWDLFDMFNPLARRYGLGQCLVNRAHTRFAGRLI